MQTLDLCKFWKQGLFLRVPTVPTCIPRNPNITIRTSKLEIEVRPFPFKYSVCFGISEVVKVSYVPGGNTGVASLLQRCRLRFDIPFPSPLGLFSHPEKHVDGKVASEK